MSRATPSKPTISERITAWTRAVFAVSITVWIGHWSAVHLQPDHGALYLLVIASFVLSTLRVATRPGT